MVGFYKRVELPGANFFRLFSGPGSEQHTEPNEQAKLDALYPPISARWATIYVDTLQRVALDTTSIVREARGVYSAWVRTDVAKPRTKPFVHDQLVGFGEYNCGLRQWSLKGGTIRLRNEIVSSQELQDAPQLVEPDTLGEHILMAVCSFAQSRYP